MHSEFKETFYMAISLIVASTFICLVVLFSNVGYNIRYISDDKIAKTQRLETEAELYKYISNGDTVNPEKFVSGSDITRFISKYTTLYKYRVYTTDTDYIDLSYGSTEHEKAKNMYLEAMGYKTAYDKRNADNDQYYIADMGMWSQAYLSNYVFKENVYATYIPYVTINTGDGSGDVLTQNIDEIVDNTNLVTFNFKPKHD